MDLKDFIKETIVGIVEASRELQERFEKEGVIINPPVSLKERDLYEHGDTRHKYRRVETVEFDVAVTASTESSGGGKAGLKVLSFDAAAEGRHSRQSEQVSRVRFSLPLVLSPASIEGVNKEAAKRQAEEQAERMRRAEQANRGNSWMR